VHPHREPSPEWEVHSLTLVVRMHVARGREMHLSRGGEMLVARGREWAALGEG